LKESSDVETLDSSRYMVPYRRKPYDMSKCAVVAVAV